MKLLACGQFGTVINYIKQHPEYSSQDAYCHKIVDELDSANRMILQADSPASQDKSQMFIQEQRDRLKKMNDLRA